MLDALRVIAVILGVMVLIFLAAVGYVMWKYRIPPRGLVAIGAAMVTTNTRNTCATATLERSASVVAAIASVALSAPGGEA